LERQGEGRMRRDGEKGEYEQRKLESKGGYDRE